MSTRDFSRRAREDPMTRHRKLAGTAMTAALACAILPGPAMAKSAPGSATGSAGPSSAAATERFAYLRADSLDWESPDPYTPNPEFSRNTTGGINTVSRLSLGRYVVHLPNLGGGDGIAHVTAIAPIASPDVTCQVASWGPDGTDLDLGVRCFNQTGAPADVEFTASFTSRPTAKRIAYLWADKPRQKSYTPSRDHQWNSTGRTNTAERRGPGAYRVRLPGLGTTRGHVQVTAFGATPARCKVGAWSPSGKTQVVDVRCFGVTGRPLDSAYTLTYVDGHGLLGSDPAAYARDTEPRFVEHLPHPRYRYNSSGG